MTKEITKANILQELQDKFKLRELDPSVFSFIEAVTPVYNIEQHLISQESKYIERSVGSTGAVTFYTVPQTERWILHRYDVVFLGAGAFTVAGVMSYRIPAGVSVYMDLTAAQTVSYHVSLPVPVVLDPLDQIQINIDGYTSAQNLRLYIDYTKETLR